MKLLRDLSGDDLAKALARIGAAKPGRLGVILRLTSHEAGEHHATVPHKRAMLLGTSEQFCGTAPAIAPLA